MPARETTGGTSKNTTRKRLLGVIMFLALLGLGNGATKSESTGTVILGLVIFGVIAWLPELVSLTPAHLVEPWRTLTTRPAAR